MANNPDFTLTLTLTLTPMKGFIPLGSPSAFDSHTCYAATPLRDPTFPSQLLYYYRPPMTQTNPHFLTLITRSTN